MSASSRVILWQLWRMTRGEILASLLVLYAFVGMFLTLTQANSSFTFHMAAPVVFIMMYILPLLAVLSPSLHAGRSNPNDPMPFPLHLDYTQPVKTATMVSLCMGYTCIKAAVVYLAVAIPVDFLLGESLPLLSFAIWIAVMAAIVQAAIWSPSTPGGRWWGYGLSITCILIAFTTVLGWGRGGSDDLIGTFSHDSGLFVWPVAGYLVLAVLAVGAYGVALAGVERQRHGGALFPRLRSRAAAPAASSRRSIPRFSGPVQAQAWCEVRRALVAPMLFPVLATAAIVLVSVVTLPIPDEVELEVLAVLWMLLVACTFLTTYLLVGHLSGALRFRGGTWSYSTFEATLPMATGRLTLIKVCTVLASGILAGALLAIGTAVAILPHLAQRQWSDGLNTLLLNSSEFWGGISVLKRFALVYFFVLWAFSIPPLLFSFGEASVAYPRRLNVILALCGADMLAAGMLMVFRYPLHLYGLIHAWGLGALVAGSTIWAVYRALKQGYLSRRLFVAVAVVWAISVGIWGMTAAQLPPRIGIQIALLFAPLLAVVSPPLALAANRHR